MTVALELAQDAFAKAKASGIAADWRQAATLLYKIRRRPKQAKRKCVYPFPVARATFGDGIIVRMAFYSPVGKPLDLDRANPRQSKPQSLEASVQRSAFSATVQQADSHAQFGGRMSRAPSLNPERLRPLLFCPDGSPADQRLITRWLVRQRRSQLSTRLAVAGSRYL